MRGRCLAHFAASHAAICLPGVESGALMNQTIATASLRTGNRFRGFTLIELLLVIAVIAILAAMLLPALAIAKRKATQTTCINNNKQIGVALSMYCSDFKEYYPVHNQWNSIGGTNGTYGGTYTTAAERPMNPYTMNLNLWHCPADKGDALGDQTLPGHSC